MAESTFDAKVFLLGSRSASIAWAGGAKPVEIGALSRYDRPQPTTVDYDQLLRKWPESGVVQ